MKPFFLWMLLLSALQAEEKLSIEAFWLGPERFRMEIIPSHFAEIPDRKASNTTPEVSRFINEGDVLWDLKKHYHEFDIGSEKGWIIYNETTGYLVANETQVDLGALEFRHKINQAPKNTRMGIEVFSLNRIKPEWVDWRENWEEIEKRLLYQTEIICRSSETATQSFETKEGLKCNLEYQPNLVDDGSQQDIRLAWETGGEFGEYQLNCGFRLADDTPYYLEFGSIAEGQTLVARLTTDTILAGGPARVDWHLYEEKAKKPAPKNNSFYEGKQLRDEGHTLVYWPVYKNFFGDLSPNFEQEDDPFGIQPVEIDPKYPVIAKDQTPKVLRKYFPREQWVDRKDVLASIGLEFKDGDFAYFGKLGTILVVKASNVQLDLVDQIISPLDGDPPPIFKICLSLIKETKVATEAIAKTVLPVRSGEAVFAKWSNPTRSWELEAQPTTGAGGEVIDIRLLNKYEGEEKFELNSGVSYQLGKPQTLLLRKTEEDSLLLRLEIVKIDLLGRPMEGE